MNGGMAGGIAGGMIGVMGGLLGTAVSIINAKKPRERAMTIRFAALLWLWMGALAAWAVLMPSPWRQLTTLGIIPTLLTIPRVNRRLALARAEDESVG